MLPALYPQIVPAGLWENDVLDGHDDACLWRDLIVGRELNLSVTLDRNYHFVIGVEEVGANGLLAHVLHTPLHDEYYCHGRMGSREIRCGELVVNALDVKLTLVTDFRFITRECEYQVHGGAKLSDTAWPVN